MSIQTNPATTDVLKLLNRLKDTFESTSHDVASAKGVKKIIKHLKNNFPPTQQCKQELLDLFSQLDRYHELQLSNFSSIHGVLAQIKGSLLKFAAKADNNAFEPLSEMEWNIINEACENLVVKRVQVSYEFPFRLDEFKHDLRICLFLAIFPKNVVLRKRLLLYWWIGEGLVSNEEEGETVFEELLDLELLIPYRTDQCPRVSKCKILPWIRCMLISVAKEEMLLKLDGGIPRFDPIHSRRAFLIADHTNLASENEFTLENLRTLFNVNEIDLDFQQQWLAKLKKLGVLHLGRWQVSHSHHIEVRGESFLKGLKTQKNLKYLSLRGISRITSLPDSIKELVSLLILDLKACHNLETLPAAIASLKKLTHLDVSDCYLLESLPKGIQNLTSLQALKGFIIGNSQRTPFKIEHLPTLKNLKRLSIHIGSEAAIQEEKFDKLKELENVKCLKISWGKADVKGSLSLPPGLQKLDLEGIPHETKPEWLDPRKLTNLETLNIKGGKLKNLFDGGEQWNNVKFLVLRYTNMQPIDQEKPECQEKLESMFPKLQYLKWVERGKNGERDIVVHEWNKG